MLKSVLCVCFALLMLTPGCVGKKPKLSEEDQAVAAFKQVVADYVQTFKQSRHEQVYHIDAAPLVDVQGGWRNSYSEISGDPKIDVRKTDSLVSPYVGTLEFYLNSYATESAYGDKDAAGQATDFSTKPFVHRHLHTYAYQNGTWVLQSRKRLVDEDWQDCPEGE